MTTNSDMKKNKGIRDRIVLSHEADKDISLLKLSDNEKEGKAVIQREKE